MIKNILAVFLLVAMVSFSSPLDASAAVSASGRTITNNGESDNGAKSSVSAVSSFAELSARIKALIEQVNALKAQIEKLKPGPRATTTPHTSDGGTKATTTRDHYEKICKNFLNQNGYDRGSRGDGVKLVQGFLVSENLLTGDSATGYYGEQTEKAVREWQKRENIVSSGDARSTGWGMIGKRTRAAMHKRCNDHIPNWNDNDNEDDDNERGSLKVNPESGKAPLSVTLSGFPDAVAKKVSECRYATTTRGGDRNGLTVDWGDGTTAPSAMSSTNPSGTSCTDAVKKHTYANVGNYTITVRSWHPGPNDAPVTDWRDSVKVKVETASTSRDLLKISAAFKARTVLAKKLDKFTNSIEVVSVETKTWTNGCLDIARDGMMCTTALTAGYRVGLKHSTTTYYAHTNKTGTNIKFELATLN